jgi:hypothetical protein
MNPATAGNGLGGRGYQVVASAHFQEDLWRASALAAALVPDPAPTTECLQLFLISYIIVTI